MNKFHLYITMYLGALYFWPPTALGEASFRLQNLWTVHGVDAPVYNAEGARLSGPNYRAELWGAATPDALAPAFDVDLGNSRLMVPFSSGSPGYFFSSVSSLSVNSTVFNGRPFFAWLQVRAWDVRLGATYDEVVAAGLGGYGESPLFFAEGGNPFAIPPVTAGPLIGLQSFSLRPVVPEPSTWALLSIAAVGAIGIAWKRRKSRSVSASR